MQCHGQQIKNILLYKACLNYILAMNFKALIPKSNDEVLTDETGDTKKPMEDNQNDEKGKGDNKEEKEDKHSSG